MTIYNQEADWKTALPKDANMKLFSERKMEFCAVFSEFLPKQKNISVSLSKAGCPKGEDFGSVKCCKYTATFGEYDKKVIIQ